MKLTKRGILNTIDAHYAWVVQNDTHMARVTHNQLKPYLRRYKAHSIEHLEAKLHTLLAA